MQLHQTACSLQAGLKKAEAAAEAAQRAASAATSAALGSSPARPALLRTAIPHEAAALQLESARAMRDANPGLESAECAFIEVQSIITGLHSLIFYQDRTTRSDFRHMIASCIHLMCLKSFKTSGALPDIQSVSPVQAMIMCGRHEAANEAAAASLTAWPASQAYLQSEALWRQGDISAAIAVLMTDAQTSPSKPPGINLPDGTLMRAPMQSQDSPRQAGGRNHGREDDCLQHQSNHHSQQQLPSLSAASVNNAEKSGNQHASPSSSTTNRHKNVQLEQPMLQEQQDPVHSSLCHQADTTADTCEPKQQPPGDTRRIHELQGLPASSSSDSHAPSQSKHSGNAQQCTADASNVCQPRAVHEDEACAGQASAEFQQVMDVPPRCQSLCDFLRPLHDLQKAASDAHEDGESRQLEVMLRDSEAWSLQQSAMECTKCPALRPMLCHVQALTADHKVNGYSI